MAQFQFTAIDASGKEQKGKVEADSEEQVIALLKNQSMFPTMIKSLATAPSVAAKKKSGGISLGITRIKTKELTVVTRQLATLLDAGLPLIRSLRTLQRQAKKSTTRIVLGSTADMIETGATFSEALARQPKTFNKLYLNMVRAGEAAGAMEAILNRLAQFMEKAARIAGKVKSAMIYPSIVLFMAIAIMMFLMLFIVPQFQGIFSELLDGAEMPALTLMVMEASNFLKENWYAPLIAIVVFIVLYNLAGKTKWGRFGIDWFYFNVPLFGPIISKTAISRFSRTLGTLMAAGVPILNALNIVRETSGNDVVAKAVAKVHDAVKEGEGLAGPLGKTKVFPPMVISMMEVGEETGKLPDMLDRIADTYEEEVDNAVAALTSLIEPIMIVGLAFIVGTIVVALFLPLVTMIEQMSGG